MIESVGKDPVRVQKSVFKVPCQTHSGVNEVPTFGRSVQSLQRGCEGRKEILDRESSLNWGGHGVNV